jgi:hypothetical protein
LAEGSLTLDTGANEPEFTELVKLDEKGLPRCTAALVALSGGPGQSAEVPIVLSEHSHCDELAIAQAFRQANQHMGIVDLNARVVSHAVVKVSDVGNLLLLIRVRGLHQDGFQNLLRFATQRTAIVEEAVIAWFLSIHSARLGILCDEEHGRPGTACLSSNKPARHASCHVLHGDPDRRATERAEGASYQTQRSAGERSCQVGAALDQPLRCGVVPVVV